MRDDDVAERLAFADAALALAGHEITDPGLKEVVVRAARHELTAEEAVSEAWRRVSGGP